MFHVIKSMYVCMYLYQCVLRFLLNLGLGDFDSPPIEGNVQFIMPFVLCMYLRMYVCMYDHVQVYSDTHLTHVHICSDYKLVNNCCCN